MKHWLGTTLALMVLLVGCTSSNSATQTTDSSQPATPGSNASADARNPSDLIVLGSEGLGIAKFGEDATTAIQKLTGLLGLPTNDTGWNPEQVGCGIGTNIREVSWGPLLVQFSSGNSPIVTAEREHMLMFAYANDTGNTPLLHTDKGIILGDTVAALKKAYPQVNVVDTELEGPVFTVSDNATSLSGGLTSLTDDGVVITLRAGTVCVP
jgi:hypothetical protein